MFNLVNLFEFAEGAIREDLEPIRTALAQHLCESRIDRRTIVLENRACYLSRKIAPFLPAGLPVWPGFHGFKFSMRPRLGFSLPGPLQVVEEGDELAPFSAFFLSSWASMLAAVFTM